MFQPSVSPKKGPTRSKILQWPRSDQKKIVTTGPIELGIERGKNNTILEPFLDPRKTQISDQQVGREVE